MTRASVAGPTSVRSPRGRLAFRRSPPARRRQQSQLPAHGDADGASLADDSLFTSAHRHRVGGDAACQLGENAHRSALFVLSGREKNLAAREKRLFFYSTEKKIRGISLHLSTAHSRIRSDGLIKSRCTSGSHPSSTRRDGLTFNLDANPRAHRVTCESRRGFFPGPSNAGSRPSTVKPFRRRSRFSPAIANRRTKGRVETWRQ